jgi:hypothetical protein
VEVLEDVDAGREELVRSEEEHRGVGHVEGERKDDERKGGYGGKGGKGEMPVRCNDGKGGSEGSDGGEDEGGEQEDAGEQEAKTSNSVFWSPCRLLSARYAVFRSFAGNLNPSHGGAEFNRRRKGRQDLQRPSFFSMGAGRAIGEEDEQREGRKRRGRALLGKVDDGLEGG